MDHPLPEGVRDLLFADAAVWRELEAALRDTWQAWGYREIILPTFEYADTLATDVGAGIDAEMYRFFDRHGRTLALRPDMTIPTARVVGTRLYDQSLPLRIAYVGSVFRYEAPRAGRQHEFTQAGVELIGAPTRVADAESIALAVALGTYTPQARSFAQNKSNLRLIDRDDLVNLILEHYDEFDSRYKGLIPLRRVYVPESLEEDH